MSTIAWHVLDCGQRLLAQVDKFRRSEIPKFTSHLSGVQKQSDIGWRDPRRHQERLFLHVVWNKPIVLLGAELGEVAPGADGSATEEKLVAFGSFSARRLRWTIQPHGHSLAPTPEHQDWQRRVERRTTAEVNSRSQQGADQRPPGQGSVNRS